MSRLPPKLVPLLVGRRSSHRWPSFHPPLVLSCLPSHLVPIPSITCVFNPLFPLMSLSVLFVVSACARLSWCVSGYIPIIWLFCFPVGFFVIKLRRLETVFALQRLTSLPPVRTTNSITVFSQSDQLCPSVLRMPYLGYIPWPRSSRLLNPSPDIM